MTISNKKNEKIIDKKLKDNGNIPKQKRETKAKGVVKVSTVTATLISAFFMWNVAEFGENREENDVTKLSNWMLSNPKIFLHPRVDHATQSTAVVRLRRSSVHRSDC